MPWKQHRAAPGAMVAGKALGRKSGGGGGGGTGGPPDFEDLIRKGQDRENIMPGGSAIPQYYLPLPYCGC